MSQNFKKRQNKIKAQAAENATVKAELNKALEENKKLKDLFSTGKMIEAMTKVVNTMTMQVTQRHQRPLNIKVPQVT